MESYFLQILNANLSSYENVTNGKIANDLSL